MVRYPGELFPLLVKENYSLHSLREKSIIPNKSQSCCPFSAVLSRTLGDVDSVSYGFSLFSFFKRPGWQAGGGVTLTQDVRSRRFVLFIKVHSGCHVRDAVVVRHQHRFCFHCSMVFYVLSCPVLSTMKRGIYQYVCICVCVPPPCDYFIPSAVRFRVSVRNIYFAAGSSF